MNKLYNSKRKLNELFEKALKFVGNDTVDNTVEVPEILIYLLLDQIQIQNVIIDETKKIVGSHSQKLDKILDKYKKRNNHETKKCEDAGMGAQFLGEGTGIDITKIQCVSVKMTKSFP